MSREQKKILVTGGAGYIGAVLVPHLVAQGYDVRVFDALHFGDDALSGVTGQIEIVRGNILHPPDEIFDNVSAVIHLAGVSSQAFAARHSPRYTDLVNHIGTEVFAKKAKAHGIARFIFASSCSIYCSYKYDANAVIQTYTEQDDAPMAGPYALSKRAAEEALFELLDDDFQPIMLRKGTLYGFSPKMRYDLVVNAFTKDAFKDKKISVHAAGEIYRPLTDIQDVVFAYTKALELPLEMVGGQIFNIAGENKKIGAFAEEFEEYIQEKIEEPIEIDVHPFEVVMNYKADNKKFKDVFGWTPQRTRKEAIFEIWDQLAAGHDYTNPKYYNDAWHKEALAQGILRTDI